MAIRIEGMEQLERDLRDFPINADKVVEKAMRKGGSKAASYVRSRVPATFRKVVKSKVYTKGEGSYCMIGLFKGGDSGDDGYIPKFFKAYWQNYGTLANRSTSHQFDNRRKNRSAKWKGGIKPRGWYECASDGSESVFLTEMQKSYGENIEKVFRNDNKAV